MNFIMCIQVHDFILMQMFGEYIAVHFYNPVAYLLETMFPIDELVTLSIALLHEAKFY